MQDRALQRDHRLRLAGSEALGHRRVAKPVRVEVVGHIELRVDGLEARVGGAGECRLNGLDERQQCRIDRFVELLVVLEEAQAQGQIELLREAPRAFAEDRIRVALVSLILRDPESRQFQVGLLLHAAVGESRRPTEHAGTAGGQTQFLAEDVDVLLRVERTEAEVVGNIGSVLILHLGRRTDEVDRVKAIAHRRGIQVVVRGVVRHRVDRRVIRQRRGIAEDVLLRVPGRQHDV